MRSAIKGSKRAAWVGALIVWQIACVGSYGEQYQVKGTVVGTAYEANGQPRQQPLENHDFTIEVSDCKWEMTLKLTRGTADYFRRLSADTGRTFAFPDYETYSFDGTDLYCFHDFETSFGDYSAKMRDGGRPIPPANDNRAGGTVVAGEISHSAEDDGLIWLAYASGCYFKHRSDKMLEVTWRWGFAEARGMLRPGQSVKRFATWELQPNPPHLPKRVTYYFGAAGSFTNAELTVLAVTNINGVTLPMESTFDVYRKDVSTSELSLLIHYDIKTTQIGKFNRRFVYPPSVPVLTMVADLRFNSPSDPSPATDVPYLIEGRFLTRDEARNSTNYAQYKFNPNAPDYAYLARKKREKIRLAIICTAAALGSIVSAGVIKNFRASQKTA